MYLAGQRLKKALKEKKVLVIGGGPAGIIAATSASLRGHDVTLIEKSDGIGGKLIPGSTPEFKHEFRDLLDFLRQKVAESNVRLKTGLEANRDIIIR